MEKTTEIKNFITQEGLYHLGDLPYDETFTQAMTAGETIVEYSKGEIADLLKEAWEKIIQINN